MLYSCGKPTHTQHTLHYGTNAVNKVNAVTRVWSQSHQSKNQPAISMWQRVLLVSRGEREVSYPRLDAISSPWHSIYSDTPQKEQVTN